MQMLLKEFSIQTVWKLYQLEVCMAEAKHGVVEIPGNDAISWRKLEDYQ